MLRGLALVIALATFAAVDPAAFAFDVVGLTAILATSFCFDRWGLT